MLEAVSSVLQNAPATRNAAEQVSTADSLAANPDRTQRVPPPQAPYVSPYIFVDVNFDKAVIQIRNGQTGDVEGQFPSRSRLQAQARAAQAEQAAQNLESNAPAPQETRVQSTASNTTSQAQPQPATESTSSVSAPNAQQQAAFAAAAQSGNSNATTVSLFA